MDTAARPDIAALLPARQGHFLLESGHHGHLWMDMERLCHDPHPIRRAAEELADRIASREFDLVCGPLVEGAFVALLVAGRLGKPFTYTTRIESDLDGLYRTEYRLPEGLRGAVRGKRVVIVNDVINAGSAVKGTLHDLRKHGAKTVGIASIGVLGGFAGEIARERGCFLETLCALPNEIWEPWACPMCAKGAPLDTTPA